MNTSNSYSSYPAFPKRGEIYYVKPSYDETGSEMWSGRPGIIVSNNQSNRFSNQVMVVYLTTKPKNNYPTNVPINATGKPSTAICEQVTTVSKERLGSDAYVCTAKEMADVDKALRVALFGVDSTASESAEASDTSDAVEFPAKVTDFTEYHKVVAERDVYKNMCHELMATLSDVRTTA